MTFGPSKEIFSPLLRFRALLAVDRNIGNLGRPRGQTLLVQGHSRIFYTEIRNKVNSGVRDKVNSGVRAKVNSGVRDKVPRTG